MKSRFSKEIISYLFWGVMTTLVSWLTYGLSELMLQPFDRGCSLFNVEFSPAVAAASLISWVCAVAFAFVTNKAFVFKSPGWALGKVTGELARFLASRLVTGVIEIGGVPLLTGLLGAAGLSGSILGVEGAVAKIAVSVIVVVLNYILSRFIVFKRKE